VVVSVTAWTGTPGSPALRSATRHHRPASLENAAAPLAVGAVSRLPPAHRMSTARSPRCSSAPPRLDRRTSTCSARWPTDPGRRPPSARTRIRPRSLRRRRPRLASIPDGSRSNHRRVRVPSPPSASGLTGCTAWASRSGLHRPAVAPVDHGLESRRSGPLNLPLVGLPREQLLVHLEPVGGQTPGVRPTRS